MEENKDELLVREHPKKGKNSFVHSNCFSICSSITQSVHTNI